MRSKAIIGVFIVSIAVFLNCSPPIHMPEPFRPKEISAYPFISPPDKIAVIQSRYKEILKGMTAAQVKSILGEPDEVKPTFEPRIWNAKQTGYLYIYVTRRLVKNGSVNERQESLIRVTFDFNGLVVKVHQWGRGSA